MLPAGWYRCGSQLGMIGDEMGGGLCLNRLGRVFTKKNQTTKRQAGKPKMRGQPEAEF